MPVALPFFNRPTLEVLEDLIGMVLVRKSRGRSVTGIIVEAEAYRGEDDPASFAFRGRTKRSERLYGPPGYAYVYLTYGKHHMLNIVTEREDFPAAVLIRAVEPREGVAIMVKRRKADNLLHLCSGPAKLCQAFDIDLSLNGVQLYSSKSLLSLEKGERSKSELVWKPRIGIREGKDRLWRAYVKDSPFVSYK
jgi:DNA-3-methyladenine glycosylase